MNKEKNYMAARITSNRHKYIRATYQDILERMPKLTPHVRSAKQ